jgi:hypothetical protein
MDYQNSPAWIKPVTSEQIKKILSGMSNAVNIFSTLYPKELEILNCDEF